MPKTLSMGEVYAFGKRQRVPVIPDTESPTVSEPAILSAIFTVPLICDNKMIQFLIDISV